MQELLQGLPMDLGGVGRRPEHRGADLCGHSLSHAQLEPKRVKLSRFVEKGEDQWMGSINS